MKGCVQWNLVYCWKDFPLQLFQTWDCQFSTTAPDLLNYWPLLGLSIGQDTFVFKILLIILFALISDTMEQGDLADQLSLVRSFKKVPYLFGYKTGLSLSRISTNN